eukprot:15793849-Heterocapsa_arctica.AAC.1
MTSSRSGPQRGFCINATPEGSDRSLTPHRASSNGGASARRIPVRVHPAPADKVCGHVPCTAGTGNGRGRTPIV